MSLYTLHKRRYNKLIEMYGSAKCPHCGDENMGVNGKCKSCDGSMLDDIEVQLPPTPNLFDPNLLSIFNIRVNL